MQHTETTVQSSGGLQLYVQKWEADVPTRAVIAITHGVGEHSGRYMNLVNHLVPRGLVICGVDLRGNGDSDREQHEMDLGSIAADIGAAVSAAASDAAK